MGDREEGTGSRGGAALPIGAILSAVSGTFFLLALREGRKLAALAAAPAVKDSAQLRKAVEQSPTGTAYVKMNGPVQSDTPIIIQADNQQIPVCIEENAVYDKVVFRGNVAGSNSALVRKTEQRSEPYLQTQDGGKVLFPRWVQFELDPINEREETVGSMWASAIAGFVGLRYPYMEIHRRSIFRDKTRMFVACDVTLDDDKLVFIKPAGSFLRPKPSIFTRGHESEIIQSHRKREQVMNTVSGVTGLFGIGLLLGYVLKNSGQ